MEDKKFTPEKPMEQIEKFIPEVFTGTEDKSPEKSNSRLAKRALFLALLAADIGPKAKQAVEDIEFALSAKSPVIETAYTAPNPEERRKKFIEALDGLEKYAQTGEGA